MTALYKKSNNKNLSTARTIWLHLMICCGMLTINSCKKFVEVETPRTQLLGPTVYKDSSTAVAALNSVYAHLRDEGMLNGYRNNDMAYYADELATYTSDLSGKAAFYMNSFTANSNGIIAIWEPAYRHIYFANAVIEGVQSSTTLRAATKNQLKGEALFLRSLLHFYLTNYFGAIAYIDTTSSLVNRVKSRTSATTVLEMITSDLKEAEFLVSEEYPSAERVRVNRWVVRALLARVCLYKKDWANAASMATAVIGHAADYELVEPLSNVFLRDSKETIWQFKPALEGNNTEEGATVSKDYSPIPLGFSLTDDFMNALEPRDQRRAEWLTSFTQNGTTWYYPYKYRESQPTPSSVEYSVVFRLAEQYLIRAEARAELNDIKGAQEDINAIRQRANLGKTPAIDRLSLLEAVLKERRVELFYEFSHRWFDLKRTAKADQVLKTKKPGWTASDTLLPVPNTELLLNPHLAPQNPGYN